MSMQTDFAQQLVGSLRAGMRIKDRFHGRREEEHFSGGGLVVRDDDETRVSWCAPQNDAFEMKMAFHRKIKIRAEDEQ